MIQAALIDDRMLLAILPASDAEIARELGMARSSIWRVRRGKTALSGPSRERLLEFATRSGDARDKAQAIADLYMLALAEPDVRDVLTTLSRTLLHRRATSD